MTNHERDDAAMFHRIAQDAKLALHLQARFGIFAREKGVKGQFSLRTEIKDDGVLFKLATTLSADKVKLLGHFSRAGAVIERTKEGTNIFVAKENVNRIFDSPGPNINH